MIFARVPALRLLALVPMAAGFTAAASDVLLENDSVRVVRAVDEPHVLSQLHKHDRNRVMIYLQAGSERITPEGGKPVDLRWKAGEVRWSPAGGPHRSEITSDRPVTMIEVEVKKEGDPAKAVTTALDPPKVDPKDYKVEFENSQVRVVRVKMPPHHPVPLHEHQLNRLVVYLTDQHSSMTTTDGKTEIAQHKVGEVSWGGPTKHKEFNLSDQPLEVLVVEFKY